MNLRNMIGLHEMPDAPVLEAVEEAGVEARDSFGRTALIHAAAFGRESLAVRLLAGMGADVNAQDENGMTALHFAVQGIHEGMVDLLLRAKADVNLCDQYGNAALWRAVFDKRALSIAQLLLQAGALQDQKNNAGRSPRDFVLTRLEGSPGNASLMELLKVMDEYPH